MLAPARKCHAGDAANGGRRPILTNRCVGPQTKDGIPSLCGLPALGRPASFGRPIPDSIGAVAHCHFRKTTQYLILSVKNREKLK